MSCKWLSFDEVLDRLNQICDNTECICTEDPPWDKCIHCMAGHAINRVVDIARDELEMIERKIDEDNAAKANISI